MSEQKTKNEKQNLREQVWRRLDEQGTSRFPFPIEGRIPNFEDARNAADRLGSTQAFKEADCIKVNPDAPQKPVRMRVLEAGKTLLVPTPRLQGGFLRISGAELSADQTAGATTLNGMSDAGEPVAPEVLRNVDLVVCGSVAVSEEGGRIGKGEGYSDLEYALLREVSDQTPPVFTTVHELQVVDSFPTAAHDIPMDLIATPERRIDTDTSKGKPDGLNRNLLDEDDLREMPVLNEYLEDQG